MLESCYHGELAYFWITKRVGVVAYRIQLPNTFQTHDVFHVSLLRPFTTHDRVQPPPLPKFEEDALVGRRVFSHTKRIIN